MKKIQVLMISVLMLIFGLTVAAQKKSVPAKVQPKASPKVIFAVKNDGKNLEPIALIENGKLTGIGEWPADRNAALVKTYYKPKTKYNLIFGGQTAGTATVVKDFADSDCASNQAEISVVSSKVKLKGLLMALATNAVPKKDVKGTRQLPTWPERKEIEVLVTAAMKAEGVPIKNPGELRYHNLTKIDVDSDGKFEFVGTFWYNTSVTSRSLLFFIAEKDSLGTITIPFKQFSEIKQDGVMSGDIKDLDKGIYHELLLDMFDVDGDGSSEIFSIVQAFEGSNFYAYTRKNGTWNKTLDTSNYHCAY